MDYNTLGKPACPWFLFISLSTPQTLFFSLDSAYTIIRTARRPQRQNLGNNLYRQLLPEAQIHVSDLVRSPKYMLALAVSEVIIARCCAVEYRNFSWRTHIIFFFGLNGFSNYPLLGGLLQLCLLPATTSRQTSHQTGRFLRPTISCSPRPPASETQRLHPFTDCSLVWGSTFQPFAQQSDLANTLLQSAYFWPTISTSPSTDCIDPNQLTRVSSDKNRIFQLTVTLSEYFENRPPTNLLTLPHSSNYIGDILHRIWLQNLCGWGSSVQRSYSKKK